MLAVCIEQALGNIKTCKNIPQTKGRLLLPGRSTREVFVTFRRGTSVTSRGTGQEQQVLCGAARGWPRSVHAAQGCSSCGTAREEFHFCQVSRTACSCQSFVNKAAAWSQPSARCVYSRHFSGVCIFSYWKSPLSPLLVSPASCQAFFPHIRM